MSVVHTQLFQKNLYGHSICRVQQWGCLPCQSGRVKFLVGIRLAYSQKSCPYLLVNSDFVLFSKSSDEVSLVLLLFSHLLMF